ncbi:MAG: hypothetical protein J7641_21500 [Cyanobacteria bacterium SID2]|nr:hypothetical protein [Cyanobacteria bacterium SID2]
MSGANEKLYRDLKRLDEELSELAKGFDRTYRDYLITLGRAVRHQLVLATYHLCTHGYPEAFLQLSFTGRQELQQHLRNIAQQAELLFLQCLYVSTLRSIEQLQSEESEEDSPDEGETDNDRNEVDREEAEDNPSEDFDEESPDFETPEETGLFVIDLANPETLPTLVQHHALTPQLLDRWQESIEDGIVEVLGQLSNQTNQLLQRFGILPKKFPPALLEAASQAEAPSEAVSGPPNVLTLLVETGGSSESEPNLMKLMTVHLRLSEIEFADSQLKGWRDRLRQLSAKLSSLKGEYQRKQRERAIVEAESAWRSSWFED